LGVDEFTIAKDLFLKKRPHGYEHLSPLQQDLPFVLGWQKNRIGALLSWYAWKKKYSVYMLQALDKLLIEILVKNSLSSPS
jgi:hypothetical protein